VDGPDDVGADGGGEHRGQRGLRRRAAARVSAASPAAGAPLGRPGRLGCGPPRVPGPTVGGRQAGGAPPGTPNHLLGGIAVQALDGHNGPSCCHRVCFTSGLGPQRRKEGGRARGAGISRCPGVARSRRNRGSAPPHTSSRRGSSRSPRTRCPHFPAPEPSRREIPAPRLRLGVRAAHCGPDQSQNVTSIVLFIGPVIRGWGQASQMGPRQS
jgi:hypothetical protein